MNNQKLQVATEHPPTNLTAMFLNVVMGTNMLPKNLILKFMNWWQSIMKINYYVINLSYTKSDFIQWTANYFTVSAAVVYIKMICITETLHYWGNLETCFVKILILNIYFNYN